MVGGVGLNNQLFDMVGGQKTETDNNLPLVMEQFARGEFDLVGIGRALLGDPQWPARIRRNEPFVPFDRAKALAGLV
jgi:2,4-dienoyl-CoA reductase-like NADH-dependent reductase (Old Yellow Enzyme family)